MHRMHQLDGRARKMIRELEGRTVVSNAALRDGTAGGRRVGAV